MSQHVDVKNMERNSHIHYHQDGLIDVLAGLCILGFGIGLVTDLAWLVGIIPVAFLPLLQEAKQSITVPRMGDVQPIQTWQKKLTLVVGVLAGVLVLALTAGMALFWAQTQGKVPSWLQIWLRDYLDLTLGLSGALVMSTVAFLLEIHRWHLYALLTLAVLAGGDLLGVSIPLAVVLIGAVVLLSGLGVLAWFLHKHPSVLSQNR
jgi:hypothetical protein